MLVLNICNMYVKLVDYSLRASSLAGLRGSRGWGVGKERELAIVSHEFEYLRPKSGREMLIGRFDQVMTYYILSRA